MQQNYQVVQQEFLNIEELNRDLSLNGLLNLYEKVERQKQTNNDQRSKIDIIRQENNKIKQEIQHLKNEIQKQRPQSLQQPPMIFKK